MKVREVIAKLEKAGWYLDRQSGSHRQYLHPTIKELITVSGNLHDDMTKGVLNSVLKKAGLK